LRERSIVDVAELLQTVELAVDRTAFKSLSQQPAAQLLA
jgi:hypothetical protein